MNVLILALQRIQMFLNEDVEEKKEQLGCKNTLFIGSWVSVGFLHVYHMWVRRPCVPTPGGTGVNMSADNTEA